MRVYCVIVKLSNKYKFFWLSNGKCRQKLNHLCYRRNYKDQSCNTFGNVNLCGGGIELSFKQIWKTEFSRNSFLENIYKGEDIQEYVK